MTKNMRILSICIATLHFLLGIGASVWLVFSIVRLKKEKQDEPIEEIGNATETGRDKRIGLTGLILWLIFSVVVAIFALLLLIGILTKRRKLFYPFILGTEAMFIGMLVYGIVIFLWDVFSNVLNIVMFAIVIFFFWPIFKVYHELKDSEINDEEVHEEGVAIPLPLLAIEYNIEAVTNLNATSDDISNQSLNSADVADEETSSVKELGNSGNSNASKENAADAIINSEKLDDVAELKLVNMVQADNEDLKFDIIKVDTSEESLKANKIEESCKPSKIKEILNSNQIEENCNSSKLEESSNSSHVDDVASKANKTTAVEENSNSNKVDDIVESQEDVVSNKSCSAVVSDV